MARSKSATSALAPVGLPGKLSQARRTSAGTSRPSNRWSQPSWAVVFPRVGGVVAELGGELSHASILLRESRRPAVVNCAGIFREVRPGARLRLDGARGLVELVD